MAAWTKAEVTIRLVLDIDVNGQIWATHKAQEFIVHFMPPFLEDGIATHGAAISDPESAKTIMLGRGKNCLDALMNAFRTLRDGRGY